MIRHLLLAALLAAPAHAADIKAFSWVKTDGDSPELHYDGKKVLLYVNPKFDKSATVPKKETGNPTTKVYHHLFDETGEVRLTNGPDGQFPHHRGIYYGFNKCQYDGKEADVWHCRNGESQQHIEFGTFDASAAHGKHTVAIAWNGKDGKTFAVETRTLTVRNAKVGRTVDFESKLESKVDKLKLDGDPQHAGFHFRANVDVEKTAKETYFLRPGGKGKPGEQMNWEPKGKNDSDVVNRAWTAMSYVIGGKRFSTLYIDHPDNPKEARQSERTYGRVGTYFVHELTKDKPLTVKYRLWVKEGEMTLEECEAAAKTFVGR